MFFLKKRIGAGFGSDVSPSPAGRLVRIMAGTALMAWALLGIRRSGGVIVAIVGAVPLLAGLFDV